MAKRVLAFALMLTIVASASLSAHASEPLELVARTAILIEETTGRQLFGKNEHERIYPASMSKILIALVAIEHIDPDEFILLGEELYYAPPGSSLAGLEPGETILFKNLLRGFMMMSGNEAGCAIALNVARRVSGNEEISYSEAEALFNDLVNERAVELGARNTNFTNPHGFHHEDHFTTAYDMALFSRAYLEIPILRLIGEELEFTGYGAGDNPPEGSNNRHHTWRSRNQLLIEDADGYYTYADGIKTGFTDQAGNCVAASAERDGMRLISVVCFSPIPGVWNDTRAMMDYGFNNYSYVSVQEANELLKQAPVYRPRLGEPVVLDVKSLGSYSGYYSREEISRIQTEFTFNREFLYQPDGRPATSVPILKGPIAEADVLGTVTYSLDGQVIFEDYIVAASDVFERTVASDFHYYLNMARNHLFIMGAVPYWVGGAAILAALIVILRIIRRKRSQGKKEYSMYYWR